MSVQRVLAPAASSPSMLFRFASSQTPSLRPCQHVLRQFSSAQSHLTSSKRKMQTSTAYQPYTFGPEHLAPPPPPRNTGIPDTSIAGRIPQVNDTRPPVMTSQYQIDPSKKPADQTSNISITEKEAQISRPTASAAAQPKLKTRPTLRARKAAMKLTPRAVKQLHAMSAQPSAKLIKVGVTQKGCSGLQYDLQYVDKPGKFDEEIVQDGVKVIVDSKALLSIIGSEMDWIEDKLNQKFVFNNPNIKAQCGCGESFMVE